MKMQDFMQKIKEKKLKRSDWLILVLAGILILIIALPTDTKEKKQAEEAKENISKENNTMEASKNEIERKLEDILEKIDGAGDVKVMITYQDSGTQVVEKDKNTSENSLEESDRTGGVRNTKEQQLQESTVYEEADAGNTPFVSKELLPKVKNQLIITALALMIAVAGYLSFTDKNGKDEKVAMEASADTADLSYEISAEDDLAEADIFTDTEDNSSEAVSAADSVVEESLENPGEAVMASSSVDYASEMKLGREQVRSKNKETLLEIINNTNIDEAAKQDALNQMVAMTDIAERENAAEMLLEAKGFTDVVVSITDNTADVVLDMGEVTDAKRAQIEDIVKRKAGIEAENIIITPIQKNTAQENPATETTENSDTTEQTN